MGACLALASWAGPAEAKPTPDWLEAYEVAPSCPGAGGFVSMVQERLIARPEALGHVRANVSVVRASGSYLASLSLVGAAGQRMTREVADRSCMALAQALSLVVALSVDELAAAPASESAPARAGASAAARDEWGPDPPEGDRVMDFGATLEGSASPAELRAGPLLRAVIQSGFAPRPGIGVGAGVRVEWADVGLWSPRLELGGVVLDGSEERLSVDAEARFRALLVNASLCPLDLAPGGVWSLRPCLDVDVGRLTASGSGRAVARPEQRHAPWLSSGASLQAGVAPWRGPVQLSVSLGAFVPLFRHEFYFSPNLAAFEVPVAGFRAGAGVAMTF